MAIQGLRLTLTEHGKIKIGGKGKKLVNKTGGTYRQPEKYNHFKLTTNEKDEEGLLIVDEGLTSDLKCSNHVVLNNDGEIVGIPIRFLYDNDDLNFPHRYNSYPGGKLNCHGDGVVSFKKRDKFEKEHPCPCQRLEPTYSGKDKCKPTATMTCVLDGSEYFGQAHKFRTTSINSIVGILSGIELIRSATRGRIAGLPLMLMLTPKTTTIPGGKGITTVYVVSICYRGDMESLRVKAIELVENEKQFLLEMGEVEKKAFESGVGEIVPENERQDFVEEFMDAEVVEIKGEDVTHISTDEVIVDGEVIKTPVKINGQVTVNSDVIIDGGNKSDLNYTGPEKIDFEEPVIKKSNAQREIISRLDQAEDKDIAISFTKRLNKEYLIYWIKKTYITPGLTKAKMPVDTANKPIFATLATKLIRKYGVPKKEKVYVDPITNPESEERKALKDKYKHIKEMGPLLGFYKHIDLCNYMTKTFKPIPINRTLGIPELFELAAKLFQDIKEEKTIVVDEDIVVDGEVIVNAEILKEAKGEAEETESKTLAEGEAFLFDNGPGVEKDQLREMTKLKKEKEIDTETWFELVAKYKDENGKPVKKAAFMTMAQAEHFLRSKFDDVPF